MTQIDNILLQLNELNVILDTKKICIYNIQLKLKRYYIFQSNISLKLRGKEAEQIYANEP